MNGVIVRDNESLERALKRFTKTCERGGIISEFKRLRRYEKPCDERKRKKNSAKQKLKHDARKQVSGSRRW